MLKQNLAGCMFWSIETDDFRHGNPLVTTAFNILNGQKTFVNIFECAPIDKKKPDEMKKINEMNTSYQRNIIGSQPNFFILFAIMIFLTMAALCTLILRPKY